MLSFAHGYTPVRPAAGVAGLVITRPGLETITKVVPQPQLAHLAQFEHEGPFPCARHASPPPHCPAIARWPPLR